MSSRALWKKAATAVFVCASTCAATAVNAQSYPTKTVTIVVPFAPGAAADASARLVAESLSKVLDRQVIVENRAGAAGNLGYSFIARAPKDGYAILSGYSATTACSPALYPKLTWDPIKDFVPVGMFAASPLVIAVNPSVPANTLSEFINFLKQRPGEVNYGTPGIGSLAHIATEMFQQKTGTKMVHVPYKGTGDLMPDLLSGNIQVNFAGPPSVKQHVQSGKLKALAVTSATRDVSMPHVPTMNEAGAPGVEVEGWYGLFAPAGTPLEVVEKLAGALKRATEASDLRQRAAAAGVEIRYLGPDATAARVKKDIEECAAAVRSAGIKIE